MKDDPIEKYLVKLEVPTPQQEAVERALHRSTLAFKNRVEPKITQRENTVFKWFEKYYLAVAFAIVFAAFASFFPWAERVCPAASETSDLLAIYSEVKMLFQNNLVAVLLQGSELKVQLGVPRNVAGARVMFVEFSRGDEKIKVLCLEGSALRVPLQGKVQPVLEAMPTADGGVILMGDSFVWSRAMPQTINGYNISARLL